MNRLTGMFLFWLAAICCAQAQSEPIESEPIEFGRIDASFSADRLERLGLRLDQAKAGLEGGSSVLLQLDGVPRQRADMRPDFSKASAVATRLTFRSGENARTLDDLSLRNGGFGSLQLADASGAVWIDLSFGHSQEMPEQGRLLWRFADMYVGQAMADWLGAPDLTGAWLGSAALNVPMVAASTVSPKGAVDRNWPTEAGFEANIEVTAVPPTTGGDNVVETAFDAGRVAITPRAYFRNSGNADVPWFAMFTDPDSATFATRDENYCIPMNGGCEPYGNDQGGKLVWSIYRLDGNRLEQIARSGVKHAFNSVNFNCAQPGGRIVFPGCEDLYSASTNVELYNVGPRSEISAHEVLWSSQGSIWDGNNDGVCDTPFGSPIFGGWRCNSPETDEFVYSAAVDQSELQVAGARYFVEIWYLTRDDVNLLNNFGYWEVSPGLSGGSNPTWMFPEVGVFQSGPVIDSLAATDQTTLHTGAGQIHVAVTTENLGGSTRYEYVLANLDFDAGLTELEWQLGGGSATDIQVTDGDDNMSNDWLVASSTGSLRLTAPASARVGWGETLSVGFTSTNSPVSDRFEATDNNAIAYLVNIVVPTGDLLFADGFE